MAIIIGDGGPNSLAGSPGADFLIGLGGDDTLAGFGGFDVLLGGRGSDTADFSWSTTGVSVDLTEVRGLDSSIVLSFINNLITLVGDDGDDSLAGDLEFNENVALFSIENLTGGSGDDVLLGDAGTNRLDGGGGGDILNGDDGDDTLIGGAGDDTLDGGESSDQARYDLATAAVVVDLAAGTATGGAGSDSLVGIEDVVGSAFGDMLSGTAGRNLLVGGAGDDTLAGFGLFDTLSGGDGNDTADFSWSATDVSIDLGEGREFNENVALLSVENIIGGSVDDILLGDVGANRLVGGGGGDVIEGREGNDTLIGGTGADTLSGGAGADLFLFNLGDGQDVIEDFEVGVDRFGILQLGTSGLTFANNGSDAFVSFDGGQVRLVGVTVAALLPDFVLS